MWFDMKLILWYHCFTCDKHEIYWNFIYSKLWWYWLVGDDILFNSYLSGQNGCHFTDRIFKHIFLNKNDRILIQISLKFVPKGPVDNKSTLVQVMAWPPTGNESLPEPMLTQFTDAYMPHYEEMSLIISSAIVKQHSVLLHFESFS